MISIASIIYNSNSTDRYPVVVYSNCFVQKKVDIAEFAFFFSWLKRMVIKEKNVYFMEGGKKN